ncbi:MAG: hypothetical protein GF311_21685 [Candidatus Lokiarchaeota archaeon]|jgi:hypothetical protein|nr:hypothetical protein [Candidatus Lokiarchaeota archaeon]
MTVYKVCYTIHQENGHKGRSVAKETMLLEKQRAQEFFRAYSILSEKIESGEFKNGEKIKKMEELINKFQAYDLDENMRYVEIKTHHNLIDDSFAIRSNVPTL